MRKILLVCGLMLGGVVAAQEECSELFISEYVEGWSNNKALEIYNPTDQPIDLSEYVVVRYSNGAGFATNANAVQLSGTIQPYSVYVAVIDKRDPDGVGQEAPIWDELEAKADGFYCPVYSVSNAMYFNGNDAVSLEKGSLADVDGGNTVLVDLFGKIGEDPEVGDGSEYDGWTDTHPFVGVGKVITTDMSLIRKPSVKKGNTVNPSFFNALLEWDTIPAVVPRLDENGDPIFNQGGNLVVDGNWESLGVHECECDPSLSIGEEAALNQLAIYPNPSVDGEFNFTGVNTVTQVEVYSSTGQMVFSQENVKGIQSIKIDANPGVYLVNLKTAEGFVSSHRLIVQ